MTRHRPDTSHGHGTKRSSVASSGRNRITMANIRRNQDTLLAQNGDQQFYLDRDATSDFESVGSLIKRLGTPPQDLVNYLSDQFAQACKVRADRGITLQQVDLDDWAIDVHGNLVFVGRDDRKVSENPGQRPPVPTDLVAEFRRRLTAPHASLSRRRINGEREATHGKQELPDLLTHQPPDESGEPVFSTAQQARRDQIIAKFTAALEQRFGPEVIAEPNWEDEQKSRVVKLQTLERDRRFNWNLVLGVGTAAAVLGLIWTGIQVNQIRQQRAESTPKTHSQSEPDSTRTVWPIAQKKSRPIEKTDRTRPEIAPENIKVLELSPSSAFSDNRSTSTLSDPLDDVVDVARNTSGTSEQSLPELNGGFELPAPTEQPVDLDLSFSTLDETFLSNIPQPDVILDGASLSMEAKASGDQSGEANRSLGDVLDGDNAEDDVPELPQDTRPTVDRFVDLPPEAKTDLITTIDDLGVAIRRIEFPFDSPIELASAAADGSLDVVDRKTGNPFARLSTDGKSTQFAWLEDAANNGAASQLIHGRLIDENGGTIFLRPSIESNPFALSLDQRRRRPSWTIGAPILPDLTRLEIDLAVPKTIDLAWQNPFNAARPRRGSAVAILNPKDGETVSIAVKMDIECTRKLTCKMHYAYQLGPNMAWWPLTESGFAEHSNLIKTNWEHIEFRRVQAEQDYGSAGIADRKLMKRKMDDIQRIQEQLEQIAERMRMLRSLAVEIETNVTLSMHLYVQWPDSQQTLLRTVTPNAAK
ncbi:MAG: hypothetical protein KDB00_13560 [Planctomycetales bacterium]|nr:hypothetical protein [Planctomycetales bacterium]